MNSFCIVVCVNGELAKFWDAEAEEQVSTEQEATWYAKYEDAVKDLGEIPRKIDARIWQLTPFKPTPVARAVDSLIPIT